MRNSALIAALSYLLFSATLISCDKENEKPQPDLPANTCLAGNELTISGIADLPGHIAVDRVCAQIQGAEWAIVATVEAPFRDGKAVLALPAEFPTEKLIPAVAPQGADPTTGFWPALSDNPEARMVALGDIFAYRGDERVGRFLLTDWDREGSVVGKSFISYYYADQPFALSGANKSYRYQAAFLMGWNASAMINQTEEPERSGTLCTNSIPDGTVLVWRFENHVVELPASQRNLE